MLYNQSKISYPTGATRQKKSPSPEASRNAVRWIEAIGFKINRTALKNLYRETALDFVLSRKRLKERILAVKLEARPTRVELLYLDLIG